MNSVFNFPISFINEFICSCLEWSWKLLSQLLAREDFPPVATKFILLFGRKLLGPQVRSTKDSNNESPFTIVLTQFAVSSGFVTTGAGRILEPFTGDPGKSVKFVWALVGVE